MSETPICPKCYCEYTYNDGTNNVCPMCGYEWNELTKQAEDGIIVKDANGNLLKDGDSVVVIKDLKVKTSAIKQGTLVKNIYLVERGDGHNISCKVTGFGDMFLKSEFVKKA